MFTKIWSEAKSIIGILFLILFGAAIIYGCWYGIQVYKDMQSFREENKLLKLDLLVTSKNTNEINKKLKQVSKKYDKLLDKYNQSVTAYAELEAKYEAASKPVQGTVVSEAANTDCLPSQETIKKEYSDNRIDFKLELSRMNKLEWSYKFEYKIHLKFKLKLIETTDENGNRTLHADLYEINNKGESVQKLKIDKFEYAQNDNKKIGIVWWSPSLSIGLHQPLYISDNKTRYPAPILLFTPTEMFDGKSYMPFLRFFSVGVGIDANSIMNFIISPVQYNIGNNIPLIKDLWIGIDGGFNTKLNWLVGISLTTTL
jgi:cell division protein FtsB